MDGQGYTDALGFAFKVVVVGAIVGIVVAGSCGFILGRAFEHVPDRGAPKPAAVAK